MATKQSKASPQQTPEADAAQAAFNAPGQLWQASLGAFTKAQAEAAAKLTTMATDLSTKATGHFGKLENIFEERVAKALHTLGMPSAEEVSALQARVEALEKALKKLSAKGGGDEATAAPKRPARARKTAD